MPKYWKFLYRPKTEGESEEDKLLRRLSFKLPVVVRYNLIFAFFAGVTHAMFTRKPKVILTYYKLTPLGVGVLCYEEILMYYNYRFQP